MTTGHDLAMGLRAAYLLMHRQTNSFLAPFGMTADQFVLLSLLVCEDGITQQELTQRASSDPNTIRAMLVRMENNGFVARGRHPTDGRARKITLTFKGRRTCAKLSAEIMPLQQALLSTLKTKDAEKLNIFLNRISDAMMQWERENQIMKLKQII
ncbi:MAG: MarR family transcriptional regulator [Sedimentisphaerales bacterium]|nr:MarR family transcriptional regulator [Sedimentisphaerales bacterium]